MSRILFHPSKRDDRENDPVNDDYSDGYNEQRCEDVVKESSIKVGNHGGIQSQSAGML
jgi:hypothetical protein